MKYFVVTKSTVEDACGNLVIFNDPATINSKVKDLMDDYDEDVVIGTLDRVILQPRVPEDSVLTGLSTETYTPTPRKPRTRKK